MPALPVVTPIPVISSTQRGALQRDILKVAEDDVQHVLRLIATTQTHAQEAMGNKPIGMLVDGKRGGQIEDATRSVTVWFADRQTLAKGIISAHATLTAIGRRVTGQTLGALAFYYSVGKNGPITRGDPNAIAMSTPNPHALDLYVAIPVGHVRKWQWLTASGRRGRRRSRDKKRMYGGPGKFLQVSKSIFETAAKQTQYRYPSLDVKDTYLPWTGLRHVDRIPAIKVCMKTRGRGH